MFRRFRRVESVVPREHHREVAHDRVTAVDVEAVIGGKLDLEIGKLFPGGEMVEHLAFLLVPPESVGGFLQRFPVEQVRSGLPVHEPDLGARQPVVLAHIPAEEVAHRVEGERIDSLRLAFPCLRRNHGETGDHRAVPFHHQRLFRRAAAKQSQTTRLPRAVVGE